MTTSPNSSAEAWEGDAWSQDDEGFWWRRFSRGNIVVWSDGWWDALTDDGDELAQGEARSVVAAMEAADLAIAELERKA